MPRFTDKIAIVTGAAGGMGRAIALELARDGATVVVSDLFEAPRTGTPQSEGTAPTHELIESKGGKAEFFKADVTKEADVKALVAFAVEKFGKLDIMINNAGASFEDKDPKPVWETDISMWDKTMAVNATGAWLGCKYAAGQMVKQEPWPCGDRGWIVNTCSMMGVLGAATMSAYAAAKHANLGVTRSVALDCAPYRVHVNAVLPGTVDTAFLEKCPPEAREMLIRLHPFRGLGQPEDIAHAVCFLASEDASWITAQGLLVDGGFTAQ